MKSLSIAKFVFAVFISPMWISPAQAQAINTVSVDPLTQLISPMTRFSRGQSSTDPSENNVDTGHFLYQLNGKKVIFDARGPGHIDRFWATGFDRNASLEFYFDDETEPRIKTTWGHFFDGSFAPLRKPLVVTDKTSSGGFVSYVPISFTRSLRILAQSCAYYNFAYSVEPPDVAVASWTGVESLTELTNIWENLARDPKPQQGLVEVSRRFSLPPKSTVPIFARDTSGIVSAIHISVPTMNSGSIDVASLNHLWLRAYWDEDVHPSVEAPLSMLFAQGSFGAPQVPAKALAVGLDDQNRFYIYFPMPYASKARIELYNSGDAAVPELASEILYRDAAVAAGTPEFKTHYAPLFTPDAGKDIPILSVKGSGVLAGVVIGYKNWISNSQLYLEGNERIYIDGALAPTINGTGTEDFFNGGWYFKNGPFTQAMSGNPYHSSGSNFDRIVAYRFFIQDPIVFRNEIDASIQYGPKDDFVSLDTTLLTYYYLSSKPHLKQTDVFHVAQAQAQTFTYPAVFNRPLITDSGHATHDPTVFSAHIDPKNNGVVIRRRFDAASARQAANISVNGRKVGTWVDSGSNLDNRWRESEFLLPRSLTHDLATITIKIEPLANAAPWSEFTYWIESVNP